jgi:hypothetical protein
MGAFPGGLQGVRCDYKADFPHEHTVSAIFLILIPAKTPKTLLYKAFQGF